MSLVGPILLVEDDPDDQLLLRDILEELQLPNALRFFPNGSEAIAYLLTTQEKPFLILSDINMPIMNGLEFRQRISANAFLRKKSIPFVFLTTYASQASVDLAYDLTVQGFFEKTASFDQLRQRIHLLISYWKQCLHPNSHFPKG